jgi:hypothetical protein
MFGPHAVPQQYVRSILVQNTHFQRLGVIANDFCRALSREHQSSYSLRVWRSIGCDLARCLQQDRGVVLLLAAVWPGV